jgi:hypothetical protein
MNRIMSSSKAMLLYDNYSHTYELEYGYYVMIMIYELVQSFMCYENSTLNFMLNQSYNLYNQN